MELLSLLTRRENSAGEVVYTLWPIANYRVTHDLKKDEELKQKLLSDEKEIAELKKQLQRSEARFNLLINIVSSIVYATYTKVYRSM